MFCTSARSRARCCSRRRNAAASMAVVSAAVSWSVMSCLAWGMIRAGMVESGTIPASPHADPTRMAGQHHARILDGKGIAEDLLDSLKVQVDARLAAGKRSEEHTSELQSLMRISYAVLRLKKKKKNNIL